MCVSGGSVIRTLSLVALALALARASPARAADPFEIQVYDGTANDRGGFGLEAHLNHVANGLREAVAPELAPDKQTHLTLEPSYGVTNWWELGAYFQTAVRKDGAFDYAGTKFRSKLVTPPGWHEHVRLGLNFELALLPATYDPDRFGVEVRPIAAWESAHVLLAINPIVGVSLAGAGLKAGPSLEPAALGLVKIQETVGIGVEYYSSLGPVGSGLLPVSQQEHYVYEVAHLISEENVELSWGAGEGLTEGSNRLVFKVIVGYSFDRNRTPRAPSTRGR